MRSNRLQSAPGDTSGMDVEKRLPRAVAALLLAGGLAASTGAAAPDGAAPAPGAGNVQLKPRVIRTKFPSDDIVIAGAVVTEEPFNARADGRTDCTAAVQSAIDAAARAGGGVVFLPEGRYLFKGSLLLRETVTLRGDWRSPEKDPRVAGTILMPTAGRGKPDDPEFISMERGSGIRNLTIWYPEQNPEQIAPYPWTLRTNKDKTGNNTTIHHVTLVNSYQGIRFGSEWNELHTVRDVYGTPLKCGIWMDFCTDIGRLTHVRFAPEYWLKSGLLEPADRKESAVRAFLRSEGTGVYIKRSDWEYLFDVVLEGYARGVHVDGNTNAVFYGVDATEGGIGLLITEVNFIGLAVTACRFDGTDAGVVGRFRNSCCQFNACALGGRARNAVRLETEGKLSFQNCAFGDGPDVSVLATKGTVNLFGSEFRRRGPTVRLGAEVVRAHILGNKFAGEPQLDIQSKGDIQITHHDFKFARPRQEPIVLPPDPKPATDELFNVLDHGARPDPAADNTPAFQAALDAAGKAGGGTVVVPAGNYGIKGNLAVPTGVELRGCFDVPHHTISGGSVLMAYAGRGKEDGPAFIRLATRSGIRGLTIWYPEQKISGVVPYPWAIQSTGPGGWVVDVSTGNAYQSADFGTHPSDGHLLRYLCGAPLRRGLWVSKGSGVVENCHFNPHFWGRRHPSYPEPQGQPAGEKLIEAVWAYQERNLDGFIFGRCPKTFQVNNFLYACQHGLRFVDDGGGSSGQVINHGSDRASHGVTIEAAGTNGIELINTEIASPGPAALLVAERFAGRVSVFNSLSWWGGTAGILRGKGDVLVQQWHAAIPQTLHVESGRAELQNLNFVQSGTQVPIGAGAERVTLVGNTTQANDFFRFTPGPNAAGVANSIMPGAYGEAGRRLTGFEDGQPLPPQNDRVNNVLKVEKPFCRVVAGAGRNNSAGLVISGESAEKKNFVYFSVFDGDFAVAPCTVLSYWIRPENEAGRFSGLDLYFSDGSNLRDSPARDLDGQSLHPGARKGQTGQWSKIESPIGKWHAGKTIKTIAAAHDVAESAGTFKTAFDDIFIGVPDDAKAPKKLEAQPDGGTRPAPLEVQLIAEPAEFAIRYTLDGTLPAESARIYKQPIVFEKPGIYEIRFDAVNRDGLAVATVRSRLFDVR